MNVTRRGGTIKWKPENRDDELAGFLAQVSQGFMLLSNNTEAHLQMLKDEARCMFHKC